MPVQDLPSTECDPRRSPHSVLALRSQSQLVKVSAMSNESQANAANLDLLREKLALSANFPGAVIAGAGAATFGAATWAAVGVATGFNVPVLSLGVGVLCGVAVRFAGKGVTTPFGIVGCVSTLVGCLAGNILTVAGLISGEQGASLISVLDGLDYKLAYDVIVAFAKPWDPLLYTFAAYQGFRYSLRPLSEAELALIVRD